MTLFVKSIEHGSLDHDQVFAFRNKILYKPWNLSLGPEDYYADLGSHMFALYRDQELIGSVQFRPLTDQRVLVKDLAIDYKNRRRGLGSALLNFAEKQMDFKDKVSIKTLCLVSHLPFYEKNNYKVEGRHKGQNKILVMDLEKPYGDKSSSSALPLYTCEQDKPLGVFLQKGEDYSLLTYLRQYLPKETIHLVELPALDPSWFRFIEESIKTRFKAAILSPSLETFLDKDLPGVIYPSQALVERIEKEELIQKLLLVAPEKLLDSFLYKVRFQNSQRPLHIIEFALESSLYPGDLSSPIYQEMAQKIQDIKDESIDGILLADPIHWGQGKEIVNYIRANLSKKVLYFDGKNTLIPYIQSFLQKENLLSLRDENGALILYSQDRERTQLQLKIFLPTEKNAPVYGLL